MVVIDFRWNFSRHYHHSSLDHRSFLLALQLKRLLIICSMSVYKIVEIVGTSPKSWEDAAQTALATAGKSLEDLRVAEVVRQDVAVEEGKITAFRVRLNLSFKYDKDK
jgi:flavin-binding protein dodecin